MRASCQDILPRMDAYVCPWISAEKLYTVTEKGTTVIVADDRSAPREAER